MTVSLPNYIFENKEQYKIINDEKIIVSKSYRYKKDMLSLRNSMHLAILLVNGGKVIHLKDGDISIDTNDVMYLSQGNYFMSEVIGDKNSYESILIFFDDEFVLNFIKRYKINLDTKEEKEVLNLKRDEFLDSCILCVNSYFEIGIKDAVELMRLKLDELFLYSLRKDRKAFCGFLNKIVNTKASRIKYILEANLDILDNVSDMAKLTRLSNKALRKEMLRLYDLNPKEWLDQNRLTKAASLLKNTKNNVSDVATDCGYSSVSWFILQFKKYYKSTPLEYREQNL